MERARERGPRRLGRRRMTDAALDPRLHAYRPDLADARLAGRVSAARFVEGRPVVCAAPLAPLRSAPDAERAFTATLLLGEPALVFDEADGWAWLRSEQDGYVGYARAEALAPPGAAPTHRVRVARTHVYPKPDFRAPPLGWAPLGARLALGAGAEEGDYVAAAGGWIKARHLAPIEAQEEDWVAAAERLLGAPYLWGGESVEGVDCSGLIQVALEQAGRPCPRDSDQQERALGEALPADAPLRRGDLIFWKGHVGVMLNSVKLLHANATAMLCAQEDLAAATARIAAQGDGPVTSRRRLRP